MSQPTYLNPLPFLLMLLPEVIAVSGPKTTPEIIQEILSDTVNDLADTISDLIVGPDPKDDA